MSLFEVVTQWETIRNGSPPEGHRCDLATKSRVVGWCKETSNNYGV